MSTITRNNDTKNFTILGNDFLQDKNLSLKTKGLISLILSLPETWNLTMKGLESIVPDGQTSINSAFKEGRKYGYIKMIKTNKGRFEVDYYVSYKKEFKDFKEEIKIDNAADAVYIVDYYLKRFKKGNKKKALIILKGAYGKKGVLFGNKEKIIKAMDNYFKLKIDFKYRKNIENFLSDGYWEQDFTQKQDEEIDKKASENIISEYSKLYNTYLKIYNNEIQLSLSRKNRHQVLIEKTKRQLDIREFEYIYKYLFFGVYPEDKNILELIKE